MGSRQEDTSVTENVNKADNINKYNKIERGWVGYLYYRYLSIIR